MVFTSYFFFLKIQNEWKVFKWRAQRLWIWLYSIFKPLDEFNLEREIQVTNELFAVVGWPYALISSEISYKKIVSIFWRYSLESKDLGWKIEIFLLGGPAGGMTPSRTPPLSKLCALDEAFGFICLIYHLIYPACTSKSSSYAPVGSRFMHAQRAPVSPPPPPRWIRHWENISIMLNAFLVKKKN